MNDACMYEDQDYKMYVPGVKNENIGWFRIFTFNLKCSNALCNIFVP